MLNKNELDKVNVNIEIKKKKNVTSGDIVGSAKIYIGDEYIEEAYIYALTYEKKIEKLKKWLFFWK